MIEKEKFKPVVYACQRHAGFQFRAGERRFRFEKHQLVVDNLADVLAIDEVCELYPQIGSKVKKVSLEQAEALVAQHIKDHGGAAKGPFTAAHGNQGDLNTIQKRDAALGAMTPEQEAELRQKLADDSELLTTKQTAVSKVSEVKSREILEPPVKSKLAIQPKVVSQVKS